MTLRWITSLSVMMISALGARDIGIGQSNDLDALAERLTHRFSEIQHLAASDIESLPRDRIVVFDVREPAEFSVSHLPGAINVSPDLDADEFLTKYGDALREKTAIFYCSVGVRSSKLAASITRQASVNGTNLETANLRGGIFAWHNDGRLLTRNGQPTRNVHPYNDHWDRYLRDKAASAYTSQQNIPFYTL